MKNKVLKLCKRLNKVTASEIAPILMITEAETREILDELVMDGSLTVREDLVYFYKEIQAKPILPLFFEFRSSQEIELIKRCFCADLPSTKTEMILNLGPNIIGKFNQYYREFIYNDQYNNLKEKFKNSPQEPRIRNFFDIPLYFYYYDGVTYIAEKSLYSKDNIKKFNAIEIKEFKKMYLKIRRKICHNKMTHHLSHHVAEAILREYVSFEEMLIFIP